MGDMKTPDFDDLLAAFDIPDIDANEAIQSSPDEGPKEEGTNGNGEQSSGSTSGFPCPPLLHSDPPVVSVIVKNSVMSDPADEGEKSAVDKRDNRPSSGLVSQVQVKFSDHSSTLGAKMPADAPPEPQIANGFEVSRDRGLSDTEPWPGCTPRLSKQNPTQSDKGSEVQKTAMGVDTENPLLNLKSPTSVSAKSSAPPSAHCVSPHVPLSPQREEPCPLSALPTSPLHKNGSVKTGIRYVMDSDEDDSEPDLVIQESPDSDFPSPPKIKHRMRVQAELRKPPQNAPALVSHPPSLAPANPKNQSKEKEPPPPLTPPSANPKLQSPKDNLPLENPESRSVEDEKYPEHVIDERDSPESPPPCEMGLVLQKKSSGPNLAQMPDSGEKQENPHSEDELMEMEPRDEELSKKSTGESENVDEDNCGAETEFNVTSDAAETPPAPLHPLKVKIKVPTRSITRTVTSDAPKRGQKATIKGSSKPSPERPNTRSKREPFQTLQEPKSKTAPDTRTKVSATAVSITKTTTLPTISVALPRVSQGGVNTHKGLHSGGALPAPSPLLSPQGGSRPASIVNSTGAIISKSQTNLVEAFNKILNNKNLLPSYKPDLSSPLPVEWGLPLPAQGYRCLECGDAFALEQSLARHYARRSLRIEVTCNHCAKRLAFFNKCSLLLHAREHKEKGLIMQCSHLVMKPVPVELMLSHQEPAAVGSSGAPPTSSGSKAASNRKAEAAQLIPNKCPECLTALSSREELAAHFQEIKPAQTSPCSECSPPMLLPNSCSAAAHQRIHQGCSPHVCPECGGSTKQPLFQTHLDHTCLHSARRIGYRCSSCLVVFGGLNSVKSHIQQAHCDIFHKCPSCPMAFKSAPSIQNHINAQHPTLTERQTMLIYKCVMCDTVFTNKALLHVHFDTHLTNQKVHVFKCPECTKLFSQRNSLLDHFKSHHTQKAVKQELPSPPAAPSRSKQTLISESSDGEEQTEGGKGVKKERVKAPSGWKCAPCHARFTERDDYINHMAELHGKTLKKFPCNKCESSFTTTSSMRRHIRDKHKNTSRGFPCQFCSESKKSFSSRALLERHIQLRHGPDAESQDARMAGRDDAESSSEQDSSRGTRRRRRRVEKMEPDEESTDGGSPVKRLQASSPALTSYAPPESGFRCAVCGFSSEDQPAFLEHIVQHRGAAEGSGQQCQQCGACFTSLSSLARHRFITHKVKNAFSEKQPRARMHPGPSPADDPEGSAPTSPSSTAAGTEEDGSLACKVCGKQFEKASDRNTHFRTHGMAFISARNSGKSV